MTAQATNAPHSSLIASLLAPAGPAVARTWERAGARVVVVPGRYSVTYLVVAPDGGVAVVDAGSITDGPAILRALKTAGSTPRDVRMMIPSHLHCDHIAGIDRIALCLGAPVALGRVAAGHVDGGRRLRFPGLSAAWHTFGGWPLQGAPLVPLEDLRRGLDFGFPWSLNRFRARRGPTLDDGMELPGFPGWTVLGTPGHSDDAVSLWHAASGFLVCGDTVRNFYGGEWNPLVTDGAAYAATRKRLRGLPVRTVFPGHGPVLDGSRVLRKLMIVRWFIP
jgi:glyoxylase-like metal-dependent hydrolase (beta-lactamase superfamily II)